MSANKDYIIKFAKASSAEDRQARLDAIKNDGGEIVKADNIASPVFPFAVARLSETHFSDLQSNLTDSPAIASIEPDSTVTTQ